MTLDELRRLNPRDIGTWPVLPKLGVLLVLVLVILGAGYWIDWSTQWDELTAARAKEDSLRSAFLDKKRQAINLEAYRKQLADIEQSFGAMLKQLPNRSEMEALLSDINQAGLGRGLQFELFKPAGAEIMSDFYAELPIQIKVIGNYHDIGEFAAGDFMQAHARAGEASKAARPRNSLSAFTANPRPASNGVSSDVMSDPHTR